MQADLERMLFDEPAIHRRLDEIAAQISKDYRDRELTVIAVLNGSLIFIADLLRPDSTPAEAGLSQCRELSRKSPNQPRGDFQAGWPARPGRSEYSSSR